ncbi:MAG: bifunctional adenosylcobinamide kinase/adenosylcobinamide-phosphate guanylyltransferase [Oscillospiraceae bacterium]|nr:bifunctional adenosylcobinamide kinase/adenosylcobinamide-phosphate guanylyltransferase [Oscillospiraceae bacterium]
MFSLIIGGAGSGKSAFAETYVCGLGGRRIYLATMTAQDAESLARIGKHRRLRSGSGFETLEQGMDLKRAAIPDEGNVLLEDLSNLLANEMFSPAGGGIRAVRDGITHLASVSRHLTVVTNEVFSDGVKHNGETLCYLEKLADLNRELAEQADLAVEVVCGLPNVLKGRLS